jgi:hypothetical protein
LLNCCSQSSHLSAENESVERKQNENFFTSLRLGFHHTWNYCMPLNFTHKHCTFVAHEILHLIYLPHVIYIQLRHWTWVILKSEAINLYFLWVFRVESSFLLHGFRSLPLPRLIRTQVELTIMIMKEIIEIPQIKILNCLNWYGLWL